MRLAFLPLLLALLAAPAVADDTIADQAQRAYDIFAGGLSQPDLALARHAAVAFRDVAGDWVRLAGPAPRTGIETYGADTEKFCKTSAVLALASPNLLSMTLTAHLNDKAFTQIYTLVGGTTYAEYTEPMQYLDAIGLGPDRNGEQADQRRALALNQANNVVQIYRPSADIIVIARDRGYPTVLARCPKN